MRKRKFVTTIGGLALAVCVQLSSSMADQPDVHPEDRVKAAVVMQLAKFVEWPQPAPTPEDFFICVAGRDDWLSVLKEVGSKQTIGGKRVKVLRIRQALDILPCQLVIQGTELDKKVATAIQEANVLTVGEEIGFAARGGMVRLAVEGGKVVFELNPQAAREKGIRFSSKVIRLARIVGGDTIP